MTPPFTLNSRILFLASEISERLGALSVLHAKKNIDLRLRRANQIRTIQGTLAIEGNGLSKEQITALLGGKRVLAPAKDIAEAKNAIAVYDELSRWQSTNGADFLDAHRSLMLGLVDSAGSYRTGSAGVMRGADVVHIAPPADMVPFLMDDLFAWLTQSEEHPLIKSSVFHHEFEYIHPFADGNGRMGRLWQTLILSEWQPLFAFLPVENLIHQHQDAYYQAINRSTEETDSRAFIEFMLSMIRAALDELGTSPQVAPQVTPQVKRLIKVMEGEMGRDALQGACGLKDRKSFALRYIKPALAQDIIEMTIPDKPNSRLQAYRLTSLGIQIKQSL